MHRKGGSLSRILSESSGEVRGSAIHRSVGPPPPPQRSSARDESLYCEPKREPKFAALKLWARTVVCATLVFAPWAFGTTERWSQNTVAALVAVAAVLAAAGK